MDLSIKKLLDDYFSKEQVQDTLRDIGETTSGNKDELIRRLRENWESHNRDIYELLDFTDIEYLEMICNDYNLNGTSGEAGSLKRRIKKVKLLGLGKKPTAKVDRSHDSLVPKTKVSSMVDDSDYKPKKSNVKTKTDNEKSPKFALYIKNHLIGFILSVVAGVVVVVISGLFLK
jgi:hypothetical protein